MSTSVADDMIRAYFDRWQRLEEEKRTISDDLKELFAEARGNGLDTKALRAVFREQVGDKTARDEFDAICDLYRASLERPRAHPAHSARGIIEKFDAETGEITEQPETATQSETAHPRPSTPLAARGADESAAPHPHPLPTSPAADQPGAGDPLPLASGTLSDEAVPAFLKPKKTAADYRPNCQNPGNCASSGLHHCYQCKKAMAESEAA